MALALNDLTLRFPSGARRRMFTAKYELAILAAYVAAPDGEKGALLRREGLYSSHIDYWRKAVTAGRWPGWAFPAAAHSVTRGMSRITGGPRIRR